MLKRRDVEVIHGLRNVRCTPDATTGALRLLALNDWGADGRSSRYIRSHLMIENFSDAHVCCLFVVFFLFFHEIYLRLYFI